MSNVSKLGFLLIDDSRHMRQLYRGVLEALGFRIKGEAEDGKSGLTAMARLDPDIVITDLTMYPMDGIEFTRAVRQGPNIPNPFVPILMLSGHSEKSHIKSAIDAGVTDFLAKPFRPIDIFKRIERIIESPKPFVRNSRYFGPDRRSSKAASEMQRRASDKEGGEVLL